MAGLSRPKDGVASARLCPAIHVFLAAIPADVEARDKPGHDGLSVLSGSPADFGNFIAAETEKWAKVIRATNIEPE